ncbi:glycosyltransferase [Thermoactinomyces sp. DSM 45892]|uniref:glycosyltransferase n=1 Tax=Thermoactinomyces sp. DSM 45892 TaxID=1882753 RepID=UPI0008966CF1|nr:glycosyltransferase family 4 protein [Thermoactinomyces sp. DSM 45892]SDY99699.1 hypothetical protein SAMN05444416_11172 [Thermoactinomyces sp. DSM 45892]
MISSGRRRFWIATHEEWIRPSLKSEFFSYMGDIFRNSNCKLVCFTNKRSNQKQNIQYIPLAQSGRLWKEAHAVLTFASPSTSMKGVHSKSLLHGIPVITDDEGDHGYYVNHLYTGYIVDLRKWRENLVSAVEMMVKEPSVWLTMRANAKRMGKVYWGNWDEEV